MASIILGWSDPKFTKTCVTPALHSASKKANEAVYLQRQMISMGVSCRGTHRPPIAKLQAAGEHDNGGYTHILLWFLRFHNRCSVQGGIS